MIELLSYIKTKSETVLESSGIEQTTRNRNRIEIQKICPSIPKNELNIHNKNSILGISINSPATTGNKILSIFNLLNKRGLTEINLLMGDSLYRYTAMIKHGCNEHEGRRMGAEQNKHLMQYYTSYVNNNDTPYRLNFLLASDFEKNEKFHTLRKELWDLFETNTTFRLSVLNFSNYYFNRALDTPVESIGEDVNKHEYASKYLIEELAIFALLNQQGINTLIYPGVIQTIYDVITMDHPLLSNLFKDYVFVSLRITRS